jgi:DNA repair photolyase
MPPNAGNEPKIIGQPFGIWHRPAVITENNFKFKSLSNWAFNIAVGCTHACRFCYVPSVATNRQKTPLKAYGVNDPDAEWGSYALLRQWNKEDFLRSLEKAEKTPASELNPDGNRAVIYCSTTDPYQVFQSNSKNLHEKCRELVRQSLTIILEKSTLNVRILTRSPMAKLDFDLFKRFGNRLLFGMSLPTLDNSLARIYEPLAPAPTRRLETLQQAVDEGLHVFVAMAPTYPECDAEDLWRTMSAIKKLNPITLYHEPVNIRSKNVERIEAHAQRMGKTMRTEVFHSDASWRRYAFESLSTVESIATELGLLHCLHLWPDASLNSLPGYLETKRLSIDPTRKYNTHETKRYEAQWREEFDTVKKWVDHWHSRVSEWPGKGGPKRLVAPGSVG